MKLFEAADRYCKESNWKTLSLLKVCLLALGIGIGVLLPETAKNTVLIVCGVVFAVTCVPLYAKLIRILKEH